MNRRMVLFFLGWVLKIEAILLVLPLLVSIIYREEEVLDFAIITVVTFLTGFFLTMRKPSDTTFYAREGFVAVAFSWILLSCIGALPFVQTGTIPNFIDALFETVSGFTTTGASVLSDVECLPKSILFWRSFTHWIGGMGVLVFILSVLPLTGADNIHIMRAESPGPSVSKLVPRVKSTAKLLYGIYLILTVLMIIILMLTGMPLFDASLMTFGTVGTGGFGILNDSAASYTLLQQGIITFFMIACGINFNVYFLLMARKPKDAFASEEVRWYLGIMFAAALCIAISVRGRFDNFGLALHNSLFQVASCMTTTGFSTVDFNVWPTFSRIMILLVMFVGGCAGSTAGGLKVSRVAIAFKTIRKEMASLIHPRSIKVLKFEGKMIEHTVLRSVNVYFMAYILIFAASVLLLALEGNDFETTVTAVIATFNNIGPGLGGVGPASNFSAFSVWGKIILIIDMLAGRLEIFPLLLLLSPRTWRKQL